MPTEKPQKTISSAKPRKRGTLRDKFAFAFLSVSVIPILVMGFITMYVVNLAADRNVSDLESQLLRQKKEEVEKFFEEIRGVFDLRVPINIYDISVVPQVQRLSILNDTLGEFPAIEAASFFDLSGKELDRLDRKTGVFPERDLIDGSRLEKFMKARLGEQYVSPIRYTLGGPRMTIAAPLRNSSENIIGVLSGDVALTALERTINRGVLGNTGYLLLVTSDGELVAASLKDAANHQNLQGVGLIKAVTAGSMRTGLNDDDRYTNFWGEKVVGAGLHLSGLPFALITEWPEDDAFELARTILRQVLIFSLFTLLAVFLISMLVARKITEPIRLLEKEARGIGEGKFEDTIIIKTNDEIEELDDVIHEMAKGLKQLEALREEFVFIAAHELRAPVTAIKGYISMILDGDAGPIGGEVKDYLSNVQKANEHLVQLVQDLLEVARSEAGRMQIAVSPQNIVELSKTVLGDLRPLWEARKLHVEYLESPTPIPLVLADPDKLREVLVNLVSNAIKYNREEGALTIQQEIKDNSIITHVRDTGIGLAQEDLKHLFEKFWRAENAETRKAQGTGLGLYIVREIVQKMGGIIWAESERGKGSTFSFSLPIAPG